MKKAAIIGLYAVATSIAMPLATTLSVRNYAYASTVLLRLGDRGSAVTLLQTELNAAGYSVGTPDGIFGPGTQNAVEAFQTAHHLTADGIVGSGTWAALSQSGSPSNSTPSSSSTSTMTSGKYTLEKKSIYFDQKLISSPMAFAANNTTYMPIWYVIQMLKQMNIQSSWDGTHWALTLPSGQSADMSNIGTLSGPQDISINGTVVEKLQGISYVDPYSGAQTEYMPIWYLMQALRRTGIQPNWDGTTWKMTQTTPPADVTYTAFSKSGQSMGNFKTLQDAQAALQNTPGGTVKDSTGKLVYTEPDFSTYDKTQKLLQDFTTEQAAEASLANVPGGVVKDSTGKVVYTQPIFTTYNGSGTMLNTYSTQSDAQSSLQNVPGGTIKDDTGAIVYTEPDFAAYTKSGTKLNDFTTQAAATASISTSPGAYVKDNKGTVVYTEPDFGVFSSPAATPQEFVTEASALSAANGHSSDYVVNLNTKTVVSRPANYYSKDSSGAWYSTVYLWQDVNSPTWAQSGDIYISADVNPGNSPHFTQFYLLSDSSGHYSGKYVGQYENPFRTIDLRFPAPASVTATQIDQWFASKNSPLQGLGSSFIAAQSMYGVNATYLLAHAVIESGWGKSSITQAKNNLFGYGAYDSNPTNDAGIFPTEEYAIRYQAWVIRQNYLESNGSHFYMWPTLDGMNEHYATDPAWSASIAYVMTQFTHENGSSAASYTQNAPGIQAPPASSTQEPVFLMNGAQGKVLTSAYASLPVFSDPGVGASQMYPGQFGVGSSGPAVSTLQTALNANGASLTVDGQFGPLTQTALSAYQSSHGLPSTGVCDFATWTKVATLSQVGALPAGTVVTIDQMRQGMVGGLVTEWYHVTANNGALNGWIDSQFVALTNVYRLEPNSGYTVPVYSAENVASPVTATFHAGDYVVVNNTAPDAAGFVQIQFVDQTTQQAMTGYVQGASVQIVAIPAPSVSIQ